MKPHEGTDPVESDRALWHWQVPVIGVVSPLFFGCLWILAAAIVAMLPMKHQMVPGLALLIIAPFLLGWIGWVHGWIWVFVGGFAFVSMFRNPLIYFVRRALGRPAPLPKDLEK